MKLSERYLLSLVFGGLLLLTTFVFRNSITQYVPGIRLPSVLFKRHVMTAEEYRNNPHSKTGNALIDEYGNADPETFGEIGRGASMFSAKEVDVKAVLQKYRVNTIASDMIPLNRQVPDSRFKECTGLSYDDDLPTATVIIPFYNEWPSILLRTVYSIINRTPRHLLQEILLLDDCSSMSELKANLSAYVDTHFPTGLVRLVHFPVRVGLIKARQRGWEMAKGDVVVFFDSHMEVNHDWLQPLLTEIKKDRKSLALGSLDYILADTMEYTWRENYLTRYGFDWRLVFFETYFGKDQQKLGNHVPRLGTVMVGTAYAVDRKYFGEIGGFDDRMKVWGGENLELAWRVWMCGGRLIHLPCSKVGHVARQQPYGFPDGRRQTEVFNYKRAIEVWVEDRYKKFIYDHYPEMENLDVGDLSERLALKKRLNCKSFTWFLETRWPELNVYDNNSAAWGSARNIQSNKCLDNKGYLFQAPALLDVYQCHFHYSSQGFTWTKDGLLRTTLQCVVVKDYQEGARPLLEDCIMGTKDHWRHQKKGLLQHVSSGLCMSLDNDGPVMKTCYSDDLSQLWTFNTYNI